MTRRKKHRHIRWRSVFLWHRYLGLAAAGFVLLLALSGLLLNHSEALRLDARHVTAGWLLDWYGVSAPPPVAYAAAGRYAAQLGDRLYLDRQEILRDAARLLGMLSLEDGLLLVALERKLLLLDGDGRLIEQLDDGAGVPAGMRRIGLDEAGRLVIDAAHGFYLTDSDFITWQEQDTIGRVDWSTPAALPGELHAVLRHHYRGAGLSYERVLLDLHSGRILGRWGVYMIDAAAVAFVLLAVLGIWVWAARGRK